MILSRQEIRNIDNCAIERLRIPGIVLMENAGRNAADEIEQFMGKVAGMSVAVVAGGGNNAGDGFVVARHLAMRGAEVVTLILADPETITGDAEANLRAIYYLGHDVREVVAGQLGELTKFDLIVDAIGGTGIQGRLRSNLAAAVEMVNAAGKPVVAIDIPTGLDCDTGLPNDPTIRAAMTVTMLASKKGFDVPGADSYTGTVRVVDIGIPADTVAEIAAQQ